MKFRSLFRVCLIFYTYGLRLQRQNNTMKKCYSLRWPCLYRMCSTDVYIQNKPAAVAPGNHHPIISLERNWAEENCRCSQNLWRRRNVVKTETQQTFVNGLLGFITLSIYTPLEACVLLTANCMSCPSIWATLSALLINILLGSSSCFCIVISLSLRVK